MGSGQLHLGTSSWSSPDWVGPFYPSGTPPERFIEHYATRYDTVEVDATYYRMPTRANVEAWRSRTPEGFTFALKTPGVITHEKALVNVADDMARFLDVIAGLGSRLGPVLLQFPYFNKQAFVAAAPFLERLDAFLGTLPREIRFAVEVRNRAWVKQPLVELCRSHRAALAWIEQSWMPTAAEWPKLTGGPSTDFAYVRFLGDRKKIEELTETWEKTVIDRSAVIADWVPIVRGMIDNGVYTYAYFNNHFAGHAPESLEMFRELWRKGER